MVAYSTLTVVLELFVVV